MIRIGTLSLLATAIFSIGASQAANAAAASDKAIRQTVDRTIEPLMARNGIAGMAVGIVLDGKTHIYNYGVASKEGARPVTRDTLFELGSVSKTFTATLASYAEVTGHLSIDDHVSRFVPSLRGSRFGDDVTLVELGTHTPGGLPLQVPDDIHDNAQLIKYFEAWKPSCEPGTCRTYANPGIGMLGFIAAKSMNADFDQLMQQRIFPALGLKNTFIDVPPSRKHDYAQGYAKDGAPIRMAPGVLSSEAYGVKSTAGDMTRFLLANMNEAGRFDAKLQRAIVATHTGYFQTAPMTQDLIWEQYPYPVELQALLDGNSSSMALEAHPATRLDPPMKPRQDVWINKTGSTNGFGAYLAFVPEEDVGIVFLANKNFPIPERVAAAHAIVKALDTVK
ncbi:class C beta-lactamase [Caballeronia sp. LP006]|uniref:class C beta-lactamase n=1 Tax=Caballeronia sp. LP006 TaxID=3038552 RepID=UPI0038D4525D